MGRLLPCDYFLVTFTIPEQLAMKYLSRYVYRTAITNRRIVSMDEGMVSFTYRKREMTRDRIMTLTALVFMSQFLQYVLPKGLQKVRHYEFHSRRSKLSIDDVREAIEVANVDVEPDYEQGAWSPP